MDDQKVLEIQIGQLIQEFLDKHPEHGVEAEIETKIDVTKVGNIKTPIIRLHVYDLDNS